VGNYEGVKSVFSGHFDRAPVAAQKKHCATTERHKLAKGDLRDTGKVVLLLTYLKICSGWIENLKVPPR
jgi:hypothetical protein